jgi:hypothetical protein
LLRVIGQEITDPAERAAIDRLRKRRSGEGTPAYDPNGEQVEDERNSLPLRVVRFQRVIAEEITDPAERAAIDKLRKRLKRKSTGQKKKA